MSRWVKDSSHTVHVCEHTRGDVENPVCLCMACVFLCACVYAVIMQVSNYLACARLYSISSDISCQSLSQCLVFDEHAVCVHLHAQTSVDTVGYVLIQ